MPFKFDLVPKDLRCPCCDTIVIERISEYQRFEIFVAQTLQAKLAGNCQAGVDVYGSALFPNLCFQVKFAFPNYPKTGYVVEKRGKKHIMNVAPRWFWSGNAEELADWYILFGILEDKVYPFVFPAQVWLEEACDAFLYGRRRKQMAIVAQKMSRRGKRGMVMNKMWEYEIVNWPDDFFSILKNHNT